MDEVSKVEQTSIIQTMKDSLCEQKAEAYESLYALAEIEPSELYDIEDQCEQVEYMLEKVMKYGTYHDSVHAIHHFVDYMHAVNELKHA